MITATIIVLSMALLIGSMFGGIIWMTDRYGQYWTKEWVAFGVVFFIGMCVYFRGLVWIVEHTQ